MQAIGFVMLGLFFAFLYMMTARSCGYLEAAMMWLGAIVGTGFVMTAMFLIKAGSQ